jgi:pimeloyl-ACP methyl ester carboxylesterase
MESSKAPVAPIKSEASFLNGMKVLGAALLTFGRSYRKYGWQTEEDERQSARTADGWSIALHHYRAVGTRQPYPVICSHGMAGTHYIYDLHPDYSLARYLARRGFDVWCVDLRGRGASWPDGGPKPELQWSFDDFVAQDFPAVVDRVCELTGAPQAFWLGMEMSGQLIYAAAIDGRAERIRGAITCGSPVLTPASAQVPGVTSAPKSRRGGRVPFRGGSRFAGPVLAYGGFSVIENSFRKCNIVPVAVARYFRNGIPDEATDLVDQFTAWVREGVMRSRDGSIVYSQRLGEVKLPLLVIAAERDLQRPADAVQAAFNAFGSADKTFLRPGVATGFSVDFGHDDLLAGLAAPTEIFPRIAEWLEARSR